MEEFIFSCRSRAGDYYTVCVLLYFAYLLIFRSISVERMPWSSPTSALVAFRSVYIQIVVSSMAHLHKLNIARFCAAHNAYQTKCLCTGNCSCFPLPPPVCVPPPLLPPYSDSCSSQFAICLIASLNITRRVYLLSFLFLSVPPLSSVLYDKFERPIRHAFT